MASCFYHFATHFYDILLIRISLGLDQIFGGYRYTQVLIPPLQMAPSVVPSPARPKTGALAMLQDRPTSSIEPPTKKQRRIPITEAERRDLRQQKYVIHKGEISQKALRQWFFDNHRRWLNQSTISESLGDTYIYLDGSSYLARPDLKRRTPSDWPALESCLFEWQQRMMAKNTTVTGYLLLEMAERFYQKLPQYRNTTPPQFSQGWLQGFKKRHAIRRFRRVGEAASVNTAMVEEELKVLRLALANYHLNDIFNMDETALFWKMTPDSTLATVQRPGMKLEKARITANFCCNASGTQKLFPWFIGTAKRPRCFTGANVNIANLPLVWRSNKKAWMTGILFKEYLQWFDLQMQGRQVVLLIDSFSAHNTGIDLFNVANSTGLQNTIVLFLPKNATSLCQPLDQGIIRTWKAHYRRRWLRFICDAYEADQEPMKAMHVLQALRWGVEAWDDVTVATIQRCWLKARVIGPKYGPQTEQYARANGWVDQATIEEDEAAVDATIHQLDIQLQALKNQHQQRIKEVMSVASFLNPEYEQVEDDEDAIVEDIAAAHTDGDRDYETDEEEVIEHRIQEIEALQLIGRLRLYEEQQGQQHDGNQGNRKNGGASEVLVYLNRYEGSIRSRRSQKAKQSLLDSYLVQE